MKRIYYFLKSLTWAIIGKKIPTITIAQQMQLTHYTNLYGDAIIGMGWCRSIWCDKYGNSYRCEELLEDGRDVIMDEIKAKNPELFFNIKH